MGGVRKIGMLAACLWMTGVAWSAGDAARGQARAAVCGACHGVDGNSVNPEWPSLAGQAPAYIVKQLQDFKAKRRSNDLMSPMAEPLSQTDIEDLAAFFSMQPIKVEMVRSDVAAQAEQLYRKGKQRPVVAACIGCHGPAGEGQGNWRKNFSALPAVLAPALGGQHAAYIVKQLQGFRQKTRTNDVGSVMRTIARSLSDEEIAAVADYIAALKR